MKIYNGSDRPAEYYKEEKQEIIELMKKSRVSSDSKLSFLKIKDNAGWTYLTAMINDSEFSINYSSVMFDTSYLIKFFAEIINLRDDIALFLDNEGSEPLLYATPIDNNLIRFFIATDYELYTKFYQDEIGEWKITDYKIECDIIIDKKYLLKEFYNVLNPFIAKCKIESPYEPFDIEKCEKYLEKIKRYIDL